MTAMRLHRYPSPSGGIALGKMGVGAKMMKQLPYDAEVEYLESTGTQWMKIPYQPSLADKIHVQCGAVSLSNNGTVSVCGVSYRSNVYYITFNIEFQRYYGSRIRVVGGCYGNTVSSSVFDISHFAKDTNIIMNCPDGYIEVNDEKVLLDMSNMPTSSLNSYGLFARLVTETSAVSYGSVRIQGFNVVRNKTKIIDITPVRFTNEYGQTEGAMYDRLGVGGMNPDGSARTDGLYRNRGTGAFLYGNDINAPAI